MPENTPSIFNYYSIPSGKKGEFTISAKLRNFIGDTNGRQANAKTNPSVKQEGNNAEFWERLRASEIETIPTSDGNIASHKMAYNYYNGDDKRKPGWYIFPMIQKLDGTLVDLDEKPIPYKDPFEMALMDNNYVVADSEELADEFSKKYKYSDAFPGFVKLRELKNTVDFITLKENANRISHVIKYLKSQDVPKEKIAAIIGSIFVEALNFDTETIENNGRGPGKGLFQATTKEKQKALEEYRPQEYMSEIERQLSLTLEELKDYKMFTSGKRGLSRWNKATNVEDATRVFEKDFEGPRPGSGDRRQTVAKYIYEHMDEFKTGGKIKSIF